MKRLFSFALLFAIVGSIYAQNPCDDGRYTTDDYFTTVDVTSQVEYGANIPVGGNQNAPLYFDFYEGNGDALSARPLIIMAFGGSFIGGDKADVAGLCEDFAEMGYACAAIDYRVGFFLPNQVNTTLAVVRGMHDMKAAVRFFYKDAQTTNTYKIDTTKIIVGGVSAGAITAIQAAYFDKESEIPSYLDINQINTLGGVEGLSGNAGYSDDVVAVINFSGAVGDTNWIEAGDAIMVGLHDSLDQVVPYDTREVNVSGIPTGLIASGSGDMKIRTDNLGLLNELRTIPANAHVGYLSNDYVNSLTLVRDFLATNITCKVDTSGPVGINANQQADLAIRVMPNPNTGSFSVNVPLNKQYDVEIYNSLGQIVMVEAGISATNYNVRMSEASKGLHIIRIFDHVTNAPLNTTKFIIE